MRLATIAEFESNLEEAPVETIFTTIDILLSLEMHRKHNESEQGRQLLEACHSLSERDSRVLEFDLDALSYGLFEREEYWGGQVFGFWEEGVRFDLRPEVGMLNIHLRHLHVSLGV